MAHKLVYGTLKLQASLWCSSCFKNGCANFTLFRIWNFNLRFLGCRLKFCQINGWHIIRGIEFTYFHKFQAGFTLRYIFWEVVVPTSQHNHLKFEIEISPCSRSNFGKLMRGTQSAAPNWPMNMWIGGGTLEIQMVVLGGCANFTHV